MHHPLYFAHHFTMHNIAVISSINLVVSVVVCLSTISQHFRQRNPRILSLQAMLSSLYTVTALITDAVFLGCTTTTSAIFWLIPLMLYLRDLMKLSQLPAPHLGKVYCARTPHYSNNDRLSTLDATSPTFPNLKQQNASVSNMVSRIPFSVNSDVEADLQKSTDPGAAISNDIFMDNKSMLFNPSNRYRFSRFTYVAFGLITLTFVHVWFLLPIIKVTHVSHHLPPFEPREQPPHGPPLRRLPRLIAIHLQLVPMIYLFATIIFQYVLVVFGPTIPVSCKCCKEGIPFATPFDNGTSIDRGLTHSQSYGSISSTVGSVIDTSLRHMEIIEPPSPVFVFTTSSPAPSYPLSSASMNSLSTILSSEQDDQHYSQPIAKRGLRTLELIADFFLYIRGYTMLRFLIPFLCLILSFAPFYAIVMVVLLSCLRIADLMTVYATLRHRHSIANIAIVT